MRNVVRRILVIRTGAIGDCILTLPVLSILRDAHPAASIDVMGAPSILDLAIHGGYARACLSIDRQDIAPFFVKDAALPPAMAEVFHGYDLIVSYLPDPDRVFAANLARSEAGRLLTGSPKPNLQERIHTTHHLLRAIHPYGAGHPAPLPSLQPSGEDAARADALFRSLGIDPVSQIVVLVHPGSGGRQKCWPTERFGAVIDALAMRGYVILISVGPADGEVVDTLRRYSGPATMVLDTPALTVLTGVLARCRFMIGNDSGITHLAAAVGNPVIALFGPTDPAVWGPRGVHVRIHWGECIITGDVGAPDIEIPEPALPSLTAVTVDSVLETVEAIMTASASDTPSPSR